MVCLPLLLRFYFIGKSYAKLIITPYKDIKTVTNIGDKRLTKNNTYSSDESGTFLNT